MAPIDDKHRTDRRAFLAATAGLAVALRSGLLPVESLAGAASAGGPRLETRSEPLPGSRALLSEDTVLAPRDVARFDLVGLHWHGSGSVSFRWRDLAGVWSPWTASTDAHLPDPGGDEARHDDARLGAPTWTGGADAIQYRLRGRVEELAAHFISSPTVPFEPSRRLAASAQPAIVTRSGWLADETIVRGGPAYSDRLTLAIVHHTAGRRPSTSAESAAVIRAIQTYHVESNGWNDIGYNFLVDPFGLTFEGRAGGIEENVVGAHALGFNKESVGIALLGNFDRQEPGNEERVALGALLAWRLDVAHVDPLATVSYQSARGLRQLGAVLGHAAVNATSCPGSAVRSHLDAVAVEAAAQGLPKLYEPMATGDPQGPVRFTARLSDARPWTVTVTDAAGAVIGASTGVGLLVDWTWPGGASPVTWTIEAGDDVRSASGRLEDAPSVEAPPPPARPGGLPRRVPAWAWELLRWHRQPATERGPRPSSAPKRVPAWYWIWSRWQDQQLAWQQQYGTARS